MKKYKVFLDDKLIGTTNFEFADVPMGIVYGKLDFVDIENPYLFLKQFYKDKNVKFEFDDKEEFLDSTTQKFVKIIYDDDKELLGWGAFLSGIKKDYEITFGGIDYELMKLEFSQHYKDYYKDLE